MQENPRKNLDKQGCCSVLDPEIFVQIDSKEANQAGNKNLIKI